MAGRLGRLGVGTEPLSRRHLRTDTDRFPIWCAAPRGASTSDLEGDTTVPIIRITPNFNATPAPFLRDRTGPLLFARWVGPSEIDTKMWLR